LTKLTEKGTISCYPPYDGHKQKERSLNEHIDRSAERLQELINDTAGPNGHENIKELGNFHVGAAVAALVNVLDCPEMMVRNLASRSLWTIHRAMGDTWFEGSLKCIVQHAEEQNDFYLRRNAHWTLIDQFPPDKVSDLIVNALSYETGVRKLQAITMASHVLTIKSADNLLQIATDTLNRHERDERIAAAESLAKVVRDLDIESLRQFSIILSVGVSHLLLHTKRGDEVDLPLSRLADVYRNLAERLDDYAYCLDQFK
jgi:hypothetical protein